MENDPLYQQGLRHFGAGEWSEAAACFTQLQVNYPNDTRIAQFLETARLRLTMKASAQRGAQAQSRSKWAQRAMGLGILVALLAIAAVVYLAFRTWGAPARSEGALRAQLESLRQTAQVQVASGQYADAIKTFQSVLAQAPGDPVAVAGLARAQQLEKVAGLYARAVEAMNAGNQTEAQRLLEEINSLDQNYRDTASLLDQIKSVQALSEQYDAAVQLYQSNKLQEAVQAFEAVRTANPNYKSKEVKDHVYDIYVRLGDAQVESATSPAGIEAAQSNFRRALSVRPADPRADAADRLAQTFLDGAEAYVAKDWETVIRKLSTVHQQKPSYGGGDVATWLYDAFIAIGDAFMGKNDPFSARDRFASALQLASADTQKAEAKKRYDAANRLTTPTPTVRPTPTDLPSGWVAPSWTLRATGTPDPYPFVLLNTSYMPNTMTGEGCRWSGITGRIFDMKGAPLVTDTLGLRVEGPEIVSVVPGMVKILGLSGWLVQWDVVAKEIEGNVQVYYRDQPASAAIPYRTRGSCLENFLVLDIQQVKPLPKTGPWVAPAMPTPRPVSASGRRITCGMSNGRPTSGSLDALWSILSWRQAPGNPDRAIGTIEILGSGGGGCYKYNFLGKDYDYEPIEFEMNKCGILPTELIVTSLDGQTWKQTFILEAKDPSFRCK